MLSIKIINYILSFLVYTEGQPLVNLLIHKSFIKTNLEEYKQTTVVVKI